jgi:hypothetical protein
LLVAASFVPDAWITPTEKNDGVIMGGRLHFGLPRKN